MAIHLESVNHFNYMDGNGRIVGRRIEGDINGKLFFQPFSH